MPDLTKPFSSGKLALVALGFALVPLVLQAGPDEEQWIQLFNGKDLDDWIVKIRGHETGKNFANTFRVEDGLMTTGYEGYGDDYGDRFGHIFYKERFSHYRLRIEYRFVGEQAAGAPAWATRNSGVMVHSQDPYSMPAGQNFPISLEVQFLGGLDDGNDRPTANMCSPGTHVDIGGVFTEEHCVNSISPTFHDDRWVTVEALVLGSEKIVHYVNGDAVMEYGNLVFGGGAVSGHKPEMKPDGEPISSGYIALQSESHPIQFRKVELLNLKGCMDPGASNYRTYFVESDPASCRY